MVFLFLGHHCPLWSCFLSHCLVQRQWSEHSAPPPLSTAIHLLLCSALPSMLLHRAAPAAAYDIMVITIRSAYDLLIQFMKKCNGTRHGKSPRKIEKQGKNGYGFLQNIQVEGTKWLVLLLYCTYSSFIDVTSSM